MSDLTFIAALRRFVTRRGGPSLIWSDHGTNFVGGNRELRELFRVKSHRELFLSSVPATILWIVGVGSEECEKPPVKLTFEEFTTVLTQVEACLNSRPLIPNNSTVDDGIEVLTPGHFLIGKPVTALPDPQICYRAVSLLRPLSAPLLGE